MTSQVTVKTATGDFQRWACRAKPVRISPSRSSCAQASSSHQPTVVVLDWLQAMAEASSASSQLMGHRGSACQALRQRRCCSPHCT